MDTVAYNKLKLHVWDVSGADKARNFWRHYYRGTTGVVFVVDTADVQRMDLARAELHGIVKEEELESAKILIVGNKQDLDSALKEEELSRALDLDNLQIPKQNWHLQLVSLSERDEEHGLIPEIKDGFDWLGKNMAPL